MMDCGREEQEILKEFLEEAELIQYHELFRDILKVTKVSQLKFVVMEDLAHIGLSKPEQRRYKKIYTKYFPNPYISKIKKLLSHKKTDLHNSEPESLSLDIQLLNDSNVKVPTKHIISVEDITINKELGMGQFGVVQQGTWTTGNQRLQVAIKCLGNERMTSNSTEFLKEAAVMHSIEHPNIVRLYGVVLHLDTLMLVTELAPLRSLLECLREVSLRSNFPVPNLCEFAEQICDGMTYLENKRLIHRDLAARNILVFNKDRVKISDFGLSRALGVGKDYYQTNYNVNLKLPVAWCAPECILYLRFTSASDVWAFGVCLWEMFTYGFQPWAAFSGQQILEAIDAPNYQRLEKPECCPESYYSTMMECWSHEPNERPKFKDLGLKLREIRPEQMQAIVNFQKPEEARRNNLLEYKSGQTITVLGKENVTKSPMWYGVLAGGACGLFDPNNTKLFVKTSKSPLPTSITARSPGRHSIAERPSLLRSDLKRHTYTGKRTIQRCMISSPQGEVKHTGHVGLDGAYFGDISFLDPAGCPPRQVVTPYKPSEDLEQMPLINPNSPSHLTADAPSTPPYPILTREPSHHNGEEFYNPYDSKSKANTKKPSLKPISATTTSKRILNKVKSATIGRSFKSDSSHASSSKDDVHEYHEISDTDTESNATEHNLRTENFVVPDSPSVPKSNGDFSLSLLEEMESMFRSLDGNGRRHDDQPSSSKSEADNIRAHTLSKFEKKRGFHTGTMKPMSAHDQKTLDTAVALANEITTRSMNDLGADSQKVPNSPSDRGKFHFKFPQVPSLKSHVEVDKETSSVVKNERRNFSEEAKSVPDIQATLTEESKLAYTSLIEQPTPTNSLITQIAKDSMHKPSTIPKANSKMADNNFSSLRKIERMSPKKEFEAEENARKPVKNDMDDESNELPLPPRNTKPKLVDRPRHIRKYPLILPDQVPKVQVNLYENMSCHLEARKSESDKVQYQNIDVNGVDMCDGVKMVDTNPFKSGANPFIGDIADGKDGNAEKFEGALVKDCTDHVSVEDLLEFADQKPCGRQRGTESDEVRIMSKVLKQQVTPEECLEALEISDWNVHYAIKVMRVRLATKLPTSDLRVCVDALTEATGDVVKASANIMRSQTAE